MNRLIPRPASDTPITSGEICSGAGGLAMAVEQALGASTLWHTEVDRHASKVLAARWPEVPNLGDITKIDWATVEPVDLIAGGTPCQDLSHAGRRAGMKPGTRSGLWTSMLAAIETIQPSYVLWENVKGALSAHAHSEVVSRMGLLADDPDADKRYLRAAGRVVGDLAERGYDAQWSVVSAAEVGAPHRRDRVFILGVKQGAEMLPMVSPLIRRGHGGKLFPTPTAKLGSHGAPTVEVIHRRLSEGRGISLDEAVKLLPTPVAADGRGTRNFLADGVTPYSDNKGRWYPTLADATNPVRWGEYAEAVAQWEQVYRQAPDPRVEGRLSARFTEWMMGWPDGWVSDILTRGQALKCVGNGVCVQQGRQAIAVLTAMSRMSPTTVAIGGAP